MCCAARLAIARFAIIFGLLLGIGGTPFGMGGCSSHGAYGPGAVEHRAITHELPWNGAGALRITTRNGSIEVRRAAPGATNTLIEARLQSPSLGRLNEAELIAATEADGTLAISIRWPDGAMPNNEGASLTVHTPDAAGLRLTTGNGAITASGFSGEAILRTSNAAITLRDHSGDIDATSGNGRITTANTRGTLDLKSSNASVEVTDHAGPIRCTNGNGRVTVTNADGAVDLRTSNSRVEVTDVSGPVTIANGNGSVGVRLTERNPGPVRIATSNASVRLTIGGGFSGVLSMNTTIGSISTTLPGLGVQTLVDGQRSRRIRIGGDGGDGEAEGGSGVHESSITTGNGSIAVDRR